MLDPASSDLSVRSRLDQDQNGNSTCSWLNACPALSLEFRASVVEAGDDRLNYSPGVIRVSDSNGSNAHLFNRIVVPTCK